MVRLVTVGLVTVGLTSCGGNPEQAKPAGAHAVAGPPDEPAPTPAPATLIAAPEPSPTVPARPLTNEALALVDADRLRAHVTWLADDRRRGRSTPSPQLDEAAEYLRDQWRTLGLTAPPGAPDHLQRFECGGPDHPGPASNVLALLPGRDPSLAEQTVMVSAHYDHLGPTATGDDRIYNGANDNASGVASLLAVAEVLAAAPPRRSVLLVAFCGEERGLLGSKYYVEHPVRPLDAVVAHVNLEMLGRPEPDAPPTVWITGKDRSQLGDWFSAATPSGEVRFVDGGAIGPVEGAAFDRSDNYPLARRGVVAHTLATGRLDALYHSPADEADRLDYVRMVPLVRAIARGVHRLAEHEGRPAWIDRP